MNKSKTVKTPFGKVTVHPNATPSSNATATISEMRDELFKIVNSGNIQADKLWRNEYNDFYANQ